MIKQLYDYWFVQFDFPDNEKNPYREHDGDMIWSEEFKKEIPSNFRVVPISELCTIIDCLHSKKPDYQFEDKDCYLLTLENITKEGYIDLSSKYYISRSDFEEWTSRICVQENDFLFTNAGRAGDMGKVPANVKCAIGRNITAVRPFAISPAYLRCFFKSNHMREQILRNLDQGSFFSSFNVRSIKELYILVPDNNSLEKFEKLAAPIIKQIEGNVSMIGELIQQRDSLLTLLLNQQVILS